MSTTDAVSVEAGLASDSPDDAIKAGIEKELVDRGMIIGNVATGPRWAKSTKQACPFRAMIGPSQRLLLFWLFRTARDKSSASQRA